MPSSSWRVASGGCLILALLLAAGRLSAADQIPEVAYTDNGARADTEGKLSDETGQVDSLSVEGVFVDRLMDYHSPHRIGSSP
ncbi:hypothetical protein ACP70R_008323 [Stipagrostis hirtigluma subsp. patula]